MEQHASLFKDDTLKGISLSIKNLQHQETEAKTSNPDVIYSITKYNPHFRNLINFLDLAFSFGLKDQRKGYWPFVKKVAHSSVIEMIERHNHSTSDIKKGYVWLSLTFIEDSLDSYIKMMIAEVKLTKFFYKNFALLRDYERREILLNLLAGIETLSFSLKFDDPYLDYGHDPVLRQERIIIRVQPSPKSIRDEQKLLNQPDVTISNERVQTSRYPDLIASEITSPSNRFRTSVSACEADDVEDNLVHHVKRKSKKKKRRTVSEGDDMEETASLNNSIEMEEDNFIPEIVGSPEYTVCLPNEDSYSTNHTPTELLKSSDPMIKSFSEEDRNYNDFLKGYGKDDDVIEGEKKEVVFEVYSNEKEEDELDSSVDIEKKIEGLSVQENEGYRLTYVSEDDERDEEDFGIYRTDSFDRFCRKGSPDADSIADEQGILAETDITSSPVGVAPLITEESFRHTHSPVTSSISRSSIDKLNDARLDTKCGILLPALPRRPDYQEAVKLMPETNFDQNCKVMISLEVFQDPTETFVQVYQVNIGHLAGLNHSMYLLVSNLTIYLLKKRDYSQYNGKESRGSILKKKGAILNKDTVQSGYICMTSTNIDNVNKVQIGLNYQDVFIVHDEGCLHVSTGDEITTRSIVSSIKAVIKSSQGIKDEQDQPMAANTNNDLDLIIQDWLICNTGVEEPEVIQFSLMKYSAISSSKERRRVMKAGNVYFRQTVLGIMPRWEKGFFALRGHMFNHYSIKRNELKHSYDLSSKCGGCVRTGSDGDLYTFKIIGTDGTTPILELAVDNENNANDWLMTICQVVGDAKSGSSHEKADPGSLISCGLVMTTDKLFLFNQDPKSGRLLVEESCSIQDITQICVDNQRRTYCTLFIDPHLEENAESSEKTIWLFTFHSEYELGKFESKIFMCWQSLYQVPLQFVLLSDENLKRTIQNVLNHQDKEHGEIGRELLLELTSN